MPSSSPTLSVSAATLSTCSPRSGWRSASTRSSTAALCPPAEPRRPFFSAYMRRSASSSASSGSLSGRVDRGAAERGGDREAVAALAQRGAGAGGQLVVLVGRRRGQDAELVAAHAIGAAAPVDRAHQGAAEAGQQRVPGRMAVDVVIGLEAVEVEEQQQERVLRRCVDHPLAEVVGERAAVAAARSAGRSSPRRGSCRAASCARRASATAARRRRPASRRPGRREVADALEVVDEQEHERRDHRREREHEQPPALELHRSRRHERLPRGDRGQPAPTPATARPPRPARRSPRARPRRDSSGRPPRSGARRRPAA